MGAPDRRHGTGQPADPSSVQRHLGIRFAEPPTGSRRWRPPVPVAGAEPSGDWPPDCPQPPGATTSRAARQDEDCLFLNVWTPTTDPDARLPVLVWFHGGSFLTGSASDPAADGAALAARGLVVVAANCRLGLLGYLAHPALSAESEQGASGNYGLLDNLAALRWVREHIDRYGGDPQRVTAVGVSAGSAALALLQTSPLVAGSFDQLILQSPGAWRPLASLEQAEAGAVAAYGHDLATLRRWSVAEVLEAATALVPRVRRLTAPRLLRPISDRWVLPGDDRPAYRAGRFRPVPTIVGGNADEGGALTAGWPIDTVVAFRELLHADFGSWADRVAAAYPATSDGDVAAALADLFGDTQFAYGARGIATETAARQPATYRYLYAGPDGRAGHASEVAGLFAASDPIGAAMAGAWARFVADGDPNGPGLPWWEPYHPARDNLLVFGPTVHPGSGWRGGQLDLLERFHQDGPAGP